jgi:ribosome biogenesis GTPase A
MRAADRSGVRAALDRLGSLVDDNDLAALAALRDRLDSARLRVLVAGEAKRGKSTLVNALLGRDVCRRSEWSPCPQRAPLHMSISEYDS